MQPNSSHLIDLLNEMRSFGGSIRTPGLADEQIIAMSKNHPDLCEAIEAAAALHREMREEFADVLAWLTTLANISGVDLEQAVREKYMGTDGGPKGEK